MKKTVPFFFIIFILCFVVLTGCSSDKKQAAENNPVLDTPAEASDADKSSDELIADRKFVKALDAFDRELEADPGNDKKRLEAAKIARQFDMYDRVEKFVTPIITRQVGGQTEAIAWEFLGDSFVARGDLRSAEAIFKRIRERYKDEPENLRAMVMHEGHIYWKHAQFAKALTVFDHLLELSSKEQIPGVQLQIALTNRDYGKSDVFQKKLEEILSKYGYDQAVKHEALVHLADYYIDQGKYDKALNYVSQAEKAGADENITSRIRTDIVHITTAKEPVEKIEAAYDKLIKRYQDSPTALTRIYSILGNYYMKHNLYDKATDAFTKVMELAGDDKQKQWAKNNIDEITRRTKSKE